MIRICLLATLLLGGIVVAKERPEANPAEKHAARSGETSGDEFARETATAESHDIPHPQVPPARIWPGFVTIVILGMFLMAAVIGPVVRAHTPEEIPPAHSHDEPPGASHHHGASGTLNPEPEHDHSHDTGHH
jgi:hypothetical protein